MGVFAELQQGAIVVVAALLDGAVMAIALLHDQAAIVAPTLIDPCAVEIAVLAHIGAGIGHAIDQRERQQAQTEYLLLFAALWGIAEGELAVSGGRRRHAGHANDQGGSSGNE